MTTQRAARRIDEDVMRAYKLAFGSPAGQAVLMDLVPYCRATESCVVILKNGQIDRDRTLVSEGRREVFVRIQEFLNLTYEQLFALKTGSAIATGDDDGQ